MMTKIIKKMKTYVPLMRLLFYGLVTLASHLLFFVTGGRNLWFFLVSIGATVWFMVKLVVYLKQHRPKTFAKAVALLKRAGGSLLAFMAAQKKKVTQALAAVFPDSQKSRRISLYRDEKMVLRHTRQSTGPSFRKMKWKNLHTHNERIRFIYITYIKKKVKEGLTVNPADTPNELYQRLRERDSAMEDRLFSLYNVARYKDDEHSVTAGDVESLRPYAPRYKL